MPALSTHNLVKKFDAVNAVNHLSLEFEAAQMRQVVYGLILVILMLYRPQGLVGEYKL